MDNLKKKKKRRTDILYSLFSKLETIFFGEVKFLLDRSF